MEIVTAIAPINIAVVKYWGKRDGSLILPLNGSISVTLEPDIMCAKTSTAASAKFECDRLWLNGVECPIKTERLERVLAEVRKRALGKKSPIPVEWKVHICSENNFPTAAGLASSAAGLACLVFTLAKLYGLEEDVSDIARLGSGSACRSMYGGFVEWTVGMESDERSSVARQIADADYWPNMAVLILVVNASRKHTSSTSGMKTTVETSKLLRHRATYIVPQTIIEMSQAIMSKDFQMFSELTMKDSNQMHAVCLDTYPPIMFLTDTSKDIIRLIHFINDYYSSNKVAYTFDAGPNACLYLLEENVPLVLGLINHFFPPTSESAKNNFIRGRPVEYSNELDKDLLNFIKLDVNPGSISQIISTGVGSGPGVVEHKESLLDLNSGMPLKLS